MQSSIINGSGLRSALNGALHGLSICNACWTRSGHPKPAQTTRSKSNASMVKRSCATEALLPCLALPCLDPASSPPSNHSWPRESDFSIPHHMHKSRLVPDARRPRLGTGRCASTTASTATDPWPRSGVKGDWSHCDTHATTWRHEAFWT